MPGEERDAFLSDVRALLIADRARTAARILALDKDFTAIVEDAQLTATDDEHDPDGTTSAFERSQASALLASAVEHLSDVDSALSKIDDGTYGRCERCGAEINQERLLARPAARTCITCASRPA
ncbi:molecular chaperone DnaK [Aeromicrobium camelliae]|uniref:Molecular chaperone DnaK n=2 Tax=Aeromicrobium camelliae TaxID=1538144 RepID=A0A3N6XXJ2_9ACTN|nr:molecular chaperone DnaK [Aeromicrobium camelliae]